MLVAGERQPATTRRTCRHCQNPMHRTNNISPLAHFSCMPLSSYISCSYRLYLQTFLHPNPEVCKSALEHYKSCESLSFRTNRVSSNCLREWESIAAEGQATEGAWWWKPEPRGCKAGSGLADRSRTVYTRTAHHALPHPFVALPPHYPSSHNHPKTSLLGLGSNLDKLKRL